MYVLHIIIQLLNETIKPEDLNKRIPDEKMEYLRKKYFNPVKKDKNKKDS